MKNINVQSIEVIDHNSADRPILGGIDVMVCFDVAGKSAGSVIFQTGATADAGAVSLDLVALDDSWVGLDALVSEDQGEDDLKESLEAHLKQAGDVNRVYQEYLDAHYVPCESAYGHSFMDADSLANDSIKAK